jgi:endonuclease/exonuclease/phosphatase family metal-dependent hydrolase
VLLALSLENAMIFLRRALLCCLCLVSTGLALCQLQPSAAENLTVMSYNIRCGSCERVDDVNHWSRRKFLVADVIRQSRADLIGLQEAEAFQLRDLLALLGDFEGYGVGRDDGKEQGEMNAVLVRRSAYAIASPRTLWLSATPDQVSRGWDAMLNRTLTVLQLNNRATGKPLYFLNTHFDHQGTKARNESAKLIVQTVLALGADAHVVLTGDLNGQPGFGGYRVLAAQLLDTELAAHSLNQGGHISFNNFGRDIEDDNKIDYVFVSAGLDVQSHRIVNDTVNGLYPSDHFPVLVQLRLD